MCLIVLHTYSRQSTEVLKFTRSDRGWFMAEVVAFSVSLKTDGYSLWSSGEASKKLARPLVRCSAYDLSAALLW